MSRKWDMMISVRKYTDIEALHLANSFTTGKESRMTLTKAYALGHTPIRTQRFYIEMRNIPLFCASQFVRSTQGVQWYMRSKRTDRGSRDFRVTCDELADKIEALFPSEVVDDSAYFKGLVAQVRGLPEDYDRYAPTDLFADCNAEMIINMSHKRLCSAASPETRDIWRDVIAEVQKVDPDLAKMCVKPCVATGVCRESIKCGFIQSDLYRKLRNQYKSLLV